MSLVQDDIDTQELRDELFDLRRENKALRRACQLALDSWFTGEVSGRRMVLELRWVLALREEQ